MIKLHHMAKSSLTLAKVIQSAIKRNDLECARQAIETQGELLSQIESFAKENSHMCLVTPKEVKILSASKANPNVYGPHKWYNTRY